MKIYRILENGYFGGEEEVPDDTLGIPLYTTRTAPPDIPSGQFAFWQGTGWLIVSAGPQIEEPPAEISPTEALLVEEPSVDAQLTDGLPADIVSTEEPPTDTTPTEEPPAV